MKKFLLLLIATLTLYYYSNAQTWDWTHPEPNGVEEDHTFNPYVHYEGDVVHDVETDASGNTYVLGDFQDSLYLNNNFITSGYGSYLAKYDSSGTLLWYKLIVPTFSPDVTYNLSIRATDLTVNTNGVFITGKYIPTYGSYECSTGIITILNYTTRSYKIGSFNFTSAYNENGFFLTKFNSSGNVVWNKIGTAGSCSNGSYINPGGVLRTPLITSDNNNNIIASFILLAQSLSSLSIGSDVIPLASSNAGNPFYLITVKYNTAGTLQWSDYAGGGFAAGQYAGNGFVVDCNSIITDYNGNIFFYGTAYDSTYFGSQLFRTQSNQFNIDGSYGYATFIAKISAAGIWQFAKELCNTSSNILPDGVGNPDFLTVDKSNNVYALVNTRVYGVYGGVTSAVILGDTVPVDKTITYVAKLNNSGNPTWHKGFATSATYANSISFANNSLYISGSITNLEDKPSYFSALTVKPTSGYREYFVSKASTDLAFQWVTSFSSGPYSFSSPMEGFAVKTFKDNVYTSGMYSGNITTLGNLNGTFTGYGYTGYGYNSNLFFGKLKDQYIRVGAVTPTQLVPGCTITVPFTSFGLTLSASNTFTAELSDVNGHFTSPTAVGSTTSTGTGSITATIPASLGYGSGYQVRIRSSDTLKTGYNYYAYADTGYKLSLTCPPPSSGFAATNVTGTSAKLNWTAVGCGAGYKVQYRVKGTTTWITKNISTNTPTLNITGLSVNTTYQWRISTKCSNNGTNSFSAYAPTKQFTTAASFIAATSINEASKKTTNELQLFVLPNPAKTNAVLIVKGNIKNVSITITDFVGKIVWKKGGVNDSRIILPVENLAAGIYIVKLTNGTETKTVKLVKQ